MIILIVFLTIFLIPLHSEPFSNDSTFDEYTNSEHYNIYPSNIKLSDNIKSYEYEANILEYALLKNVSKYINMDMILRKDIGFYDRGDYKAIKNQCLDLYDGETNDIELKLKRLGYFIDTLLPIVIHPYSSLHLNHTYMISRILFNTELALADAWVNLDAKLADSYDKKFRNYINNQWLYRWAYYRPFRIYQKIKDLFSEYEICNDSEMFRKVCDDMIFSRWKIFMSRLNIVLNLDMALSFLQGIEDGLHHFLTEICSFCNMTNQKRQDICNSTLDVVKNESMKVILNNFLEKDLSFIIKRLCSVVVSRYEEDEAYLEFERIKNKARNLVQSKLFSRYGVESEYPIKIIDSDISKSRNIIIARVIKSKILAQVSEFQPLWEMRYQYDSIPRVDQCLSKNELDLLYKSLNQLIDTVKNTSRSFESNYCPLLLKLSSTSIYGSFAKYIIENERKKVLDAILDKYIGLPRIYDDEAAKMISMYKKKLMHEYLYMCIICYYAPMDLTDPLHILGILDKFPLNYTLDDVEDGLSMIFKNRYTEPKITSDPERSKFVSNLGNWITMSCIYLDQRKLSNSTEYDTCISKIGFNDIEYASIKSFETSQTWMEPNSQIILDNSSLVFNYHLSEFDRVYGKYTSGPKNLSLEDKIIEKDSNYYSMVKALLKLLTPYFLQGPRFHSIYSDILGILDSANGFRNLFGIAILLVEKDEFEIIDDIFSFAAAAQFESYIIKSIDTASRMSMDEKVTVFKESMQWILYMIPQSFHSSRYHSGIVYKAYYDLTAKLMSHWVHFLVHAAIPDSNTEIPNYPLCNYFFDMHLSNYMILMLDYSVPPQAESNILHDIHRVIHEPSLLYRKAAYDLHVLHGMVESIMYYWRDHLDHFHSDNFTRISVAFDGLAEQSEHNDLFPNAKEMLRYGNYLDLARQRFMIISMAIDALKNPEEFFLGSFIQRSVVNATKILEEKAFPILLHSNLEEWMNQQSFCHILLLPRVYDALVLALKEILVHPQDTEIQAIDRMDIMLNPYKSDSNLILDIEYFRFATKFDTFSNTGINKILIFERAIRNCLLERSESGISRTLWISRNVEKTHKLGSRIESFLNDLFTIAARSHVNLDTYEALLNQSLKNVDIAFNMLDMTLESRFIAKSNAIKYFIESLSMLFKNQVIYRVQYIDPLKDPIIESNRSLEHASYYYCAKKNCTVAERCILAKNMIINDMKEWLIRIMDIYSKDKLTLQVLDHNNLEKMVSDFSKIILDSECGQNGLIIFRFKDSVHTIKQKFLNFTKYQQVWELSDWKQDILKTHVHEFLLYRALQELSRFLYTYEYSGTTEMIDKFVVQITNSLQLSFDLVIDLRGNAVTALKIYLNSLESLNEARLRGMDTSTLTFLRSLLDGSMLRVMPFLIWGYNIEENYYTIAQENISKAVEQVSIKVEYLKKELGEISSQKILKGVYWFNNTCMNLFKNKNILELSPAKTTSDLRTNLLYIATRTEPWNLKIGLWKNISSDIDTSIIRHLELSIMIEWNKTQLVLECNNNVTNRTLIDSYDALGKFSNETIKRIVPDAISLAGISYSTYKTIRLVRLVAIRSLLNCNKQLHNIISLDDHKINHLINDINELFLGSIEKITINLLKFHASRANTFCILVKDRVKSMLDSFKFDLFHEESDIKLEFSVVVKMFQNTLNFIDILDCQGKPMLMIADKSY